MYKPTLLASPAPTSVKYASHPIAITKNEIKSSTLTNGILQAILDQLSNSEPNPIKQRPPIRS